MRLQEILKAIRNLSVNEILLLQEQIGKTLYAKGVEDFIRARQYGKEFKEIISSPKEDSINK